MWLDKPVPEKLAGEAGLNIEFLPSQYWLKTYNVDGRLGRLPRYATSQTITRPNAEKPCQFKGFKTYDDRGTNRFIDPLPIETGHKITLATDQPDRMVTISSDAELKLYDGRILAQNGWYVLRSVFAQLMRIMPDDSSEQAYQGEIKTWGPYYKYNYVKFDFSEVRQPGVYFIQYGNTRSNDFIIDDHVYDKITDATNDVWVPIHMNHMYVNEGYRTWHGEPFKEGYLQAPPSDHFENFDDWPFLWGQNEGTIAGNTQYVIFESSFKNIVTK